MSSASITIRDATARDFDIILALNAESVQFLSPLDAAGLQRLHAQATYHRVAQINGAMAAFLVAFREGADYDSPNYRWFATAYPRFLYIDRVVVSKTARGIGLGARLYSDILAFAQSTLCERVTCEFDLEPPNPVSAAFHARFGFREVGRQWVGSAKQKQVSLQERPLAA